MIWSDYVIATRKFILYPSSTANLYLGFSLIGEVGELVGMIAKQWRGDELDRDLLTKEIGDVLFFLARISEDTGISIENNWFYTDQDMMSKNVLRDVTIVSNELADNYMENFHISPGFWKDLLSYIQIIVNHFNLDLDTILDVNYNKLEDRFNRGVIKGNGDTR